MSELQQVLEELKDIKTRLKYQNRLGLSGGRRYIAIEADKNSLWHYCDDDSTPVTETILTGYIRRIERREGDYPKLHIFVEADYDYVLVSGFSTHFSRQAMAAIASMSSQQLSLPVIIKPDTGNDDGKIKGKKPVFCNLIQDGRTIRSGQLGTRDAEELYQMAIAVLQGVSSTQAQELPNQIVRSPQQPRPKPPGLDDELSPVNQAIAPVAASQRSDEASAMKMESVDWQAFCLQYGVQKQALIALAQELGLPMGKLDSRQSALLYHHAYSRFGGAA